MPAFSVSAATSARAACVAVRLWRTDRHRADAMTITAQEALDSVARFQQQTLEDAGRIE